MILTFVVAPQVDLGFAGPVVAYAWPSLGEQARYAEDRRRCRPGQPAVLQLRRLVEELLAAVRADVGCCITLHLKAGQLGAAAQLPAWCRAEQCPCHATQDRPGHRTSQWSCVKSTASSSSGHTCVAMHRQQDC